MSPSSQKHLLFATCPPGLEPVLHQELKALRIKHIEERTGGVHFEGTWQDIWRANLELRTAIRVLKRLDRFQAPDADALYGNIHALPWEELLSPEGSLWIDARVSDSNMTHSQFVAQRTKDAIVDRLRTESGIRPSVDRESPDLRLNLHLFRDRVTLSIDTSGDSLHKRGWRTAQGRAPLSEVLAAALVLHSGWDSRSPLLDPFVGSGTILIEAALLATRSAPGLFREGFAFERLPDHDAKAYRRLRAEVESQRIARPKLRLIGGDLDAERLADAKANAESAGLGDMLELEVADARELSPLPGWNAWIVTNPPYGERLNSGEDLAPLYRAFGTQLRTACEGYTLGLITGRPELATALNLPRLTARTWIHGGIEALVVTGRLGG